MQIMSIYAKPPCTQAHGARWLLLSAHTQTACINACGACVMTQSNEVMQLQSTGFAQSILNPSALHCNCMAVSPGAKTPIQSPTLVPFVSCTIVPAKCQEHAFLVVGQDLQPHDLTVKQQNVH